MATYRRCRACGDYHWTDAWPDNHVEPEPERSPLPMPNVMGDIPEYRSPVGTGVISSRSQRREDLKRAGCREVDPAERPERTELKRAVKYREKLAQQNKSSLRSSA